MIEKTIDEEEPMPALENLNHMDTDMEIAIYDEFVEELKRDKLLNLDNLNHINFNQKNMMINNKKVSESLHKKYSKIFKEMKGGEINENSNFAFTVVLDKKGKIIQENTIGVPVPPAPEGSKNSSQSSYSYSYSTSEAPESGETYKEEKFDKWLETQLIKDGYLIDPSQYALMWNSKTFLIDNIEVDAEDVKKYAQKREEMTGLKISPTFMKTRNVTK